MSKRVLILSGSPRIGGNSDILCDEFMRGAIESGNQVEKINVSRKKIDYCMGCYYCQTHNGECAIKDDMTEIRKLDSGKRFFNMTLEQQEQMLGSWKPED